MKTRLLFLLSSLATFPSAAQVADTESLKAAAYFKEAQQASATQMLWPKALYGPTLFVNPQSRRTWANSPDSAGILTSTGAIYTGILPNDVVIANTAISWQGHLWSVILWPLPADQQERLSLILHESFHRIQGSLGLPTNDPTADHLSTMDGRIYFLLELQALKTALIKPINQRQMDLTNALLFRKKRQVLFPKTFLNEQRLEMNEGLAEFTGILLGRQKDKIGTYLNELVDQAATRKSLIRSSAYLTGPIYGYLLYQKAPRWTLGLDAKASFPGLITAYYHLTEPRNLTAKALTTAINAYDGIRIFRAERLTEHERQKLVQQYMNQFTRQPTLKIDLINMRINFNPNTLFDLGPYGTVYPTGQLNDTWGELTVESGGMLLKDWKSVYVPMSLDRQPTNGLSQGAGWKLTLAKGWKIRKLDELHYTVTLTD